MSSEQDWFFTFGYSQKHGPNGYTVFNGTFETARQQMVEKYGNKWSFQYPTAEDAGVEQYRLIKIN